MSDTEEKEVIEEPVSEVPEKVDKRKVRSEKQLEALKVAREKAMEMRKTNAEYTRKQKELKKFQKDEKRKEVERMYDEMVAKQKKESDPEPEPEPEPPLEHKVKRRKPKRQPEPQPQHSESESESEPEAEPEPPRPPLQRPIVNKNHAKVLHDYQHAFEFFS